MRKFRVVPLVLVITFGLSLIGSWWWGSGTQYLHSVDPSDQTFGNGRGKMEASTGGNHPSPEITNLWIEEERRTYAERTLKDPALDWKAPINFWGRVLDEHDGPIPAALIEFSWTDLSATGHQRSFTNSNAAGDFSHTGRTGKRLLVTVSKAGYYAFPDQFFGAFEYGNPWERFHPDPKNPMVFRLKKAGKLEPLVSYFVILPVSNQGKPMEYDLLAARWMEPGTIRFECLVGPADQEARKRDWHFLMRIPGGGFVARTNALDFEAPTSGYAQEIEASESWTNTPWQGGFKGAFFVKFGEPVRFGRIDVRWLPQRAGNHATSSLEMKCWVNPSGSRNLEDNPTRELKQISRQYLRTGPPNQSGPD